MKNQPHQVETIPAFLEGGGEMGALTRKYDWTSTSLGSFRNWPLNLQLVVSTLLHSRFPMFLFWGPELIQFYNDAYRPSLGTNGKHPAALGQRAEECWPEIWSRIKPLLDKVMQHGETVWYENLCLPIYRNGALEDVYWTFSYSPVKGEQGTIDGALVVCTETTASVLAANKIKETSDQLSFAIDAAELATWDFNPVTRCFRGNFRLREWFGLDGSAEDIALQSAMDAIAEKDRAAVRKAIERALQISSGGNYEIEYTITNAKTGQERIVRAKGKALFDNEQQPYRFTGTLQDITAEVFGRNQRQKLLKLVDNSVDLMSILELNGTNSYINAAGRDILGISQDADVSQIPISDFHTPDQIAFVESNIIPTVMGKGRWAGEFAIRHGQTGEIIPLYNNCHRIDDLETGEPIGVGAVMRDMRPELNARKILEEKVKERTKELQQLNEELEKKNQDLASFAYVSSHDLQEPLRKINTFISRIEEAGNNADPVKLKEYFRKIKNSATRMQQLINDLLSFSRLDTSDTEKEPTDLNVLLASVRSDLSESIKRTGAVIEAGNLPTLNVVKYQFHQLFTNLISNAIKFTGVDNTPMITISATTSQAGEEKIAESHFSGGYLHIRVQDNGIGFEEQYSQRIFEVFQRLHDKNQYEGTGIGLSICKKVVENHEGVIRAEGIPGKGACFHIYLPMENE